MTAVICWERRVGPLSELVVISDSRLGGGQRWDACPKIFATGRGDAVLAFAGDTLRAYPLILQALATVSSYQASSRGDLDIRDLASHLAHALNHMRSINTRDEANANPDCELLLAGWSWRLGKFRAYPIRYETGRNAEGETVRKFIASPAGPAPAVLGGSSATAVYATLGDAGTKVTGGLVRMSQARTSPLDMQPVSVLADLCGSNRLEHDTVGGPPQIAKVYRTMRTELFATRWKQTVSISGRPMLRGENHDLRTASPTDDGSWRIEEV